MKVKQLFTTNNSIVPFAWIDSDFIAAFGDGEIKQDVTVQPLTGQKLHRDMMSAEIRAELKPDFVSPAELYETLKTLDHDVWGLFYVQNSGVSRLVYVYWSSVRRGWLVCSNPLTRSNQWSAGRRVFSRKLVSTGNLGASDPLTLELLERVKSLEAWRDKLTAAWQGMGGSET